jgi:hypothetical protein
MMAMAVEIAVMIVIYVQISTVSKRWNISKAAYPDMSKVDIIRGCTVSSSCKSNNCSDPDDDADRQPLDYCKRQFLPASLVAITSNHSINYTWYHLRLPPSCGLPFLSISSSWAKNDSRSPPSGTT